MKTLALPMVDTFALRASGMPRAFLCPGSVRAPTLAINQSSEPARLGSAVHEALQPVAEGDGIQWDGLPAIAERWAVDIEEVRALTATGAKLWNTVIPGGTATVGDSFRGALSEIAFSAELAPGLVLTGHVDFIATAGRTARIGDFKTGRKDSDYKHQMMAYAALAMLDNRDLDEVTSTVLWVREQEIENLTVSREAAAAWVDKLLAKVVNWDGVFHPGDHCGYCQRYHECDAANASARADTAIILDVDIAASLATMAPAEVVSLYQKASAVMKCAERVRAAIKERVELEGDIACDGGVLTIETESRRKLDTLATWPVLDGLGFSDVDFAEVVEVRVTKLEKHVASRAGRGKGAAAVRDLTARLEAAEATRTNEVQKLNLKRRAG